MRPPDLARIAAMKPDQTTLPAGTDVIRKGERGRTLFTLCKGWALRYHRLADGTRQILDVLLPGDTIGLGGVLLGIHAHSVQSLTAVSVCTLGIGQVVALTAEHPAFLQGLLRTQLEEERRADMRLTMLGRMGAAERVAYFAMEIHARLRRRGLASTTACPFPLRRTDLADAVGLSRVHVMRALRQLYLDTEARLHGGKLLVPDSARLAGYAGFSEPRVGRRAVL
jgi:CRP/FNR family transcriptional regulator, anaerobic regulatory protein